VWREIIVGVKRQSVKQRLPLALTFWVNRMIALAPRPSFLIPQAGTAYPYIVGTVALWTQSISLLLF